MTSATNIALGMVQLLRRANAANPRVLIIDTDLQGYTSLVTTGRKDYGADYVCTVCCWQIVKMCRKYC